MTHGDGRRGVEFGGFFFEGVEGVEAEELVQDVDCGGVELVAEAFGLQGFVEVLYYEVLGVLTENVSDCEIEIGL